MDKYTLLRLYLALALAIAMIPLYLTWGIQHHFRFVTGERSSKLKNIKKWKVPLNVTVNLLIVLFIGVLLTQRAIPAVQDLPNVIHEQYVSVEGTVQADDSTSTSHSKLKSNKIQVATEDGETVELVCFGEDIDAGTEVSAVYLPHSHYATVTKRDD